MSATIRDIPAAVKLAAETRKPVSLRFGNGLVLFITPAGTKSWRCPATVNGRRHWEVLGHFPQMHVRDAHSARQRVRDTVRAGGNPAADRHARRARRQAHDTATVRAVAEAWVNEPGMIQRWSPGYRHMLRQRLENHIFPAWGDRPIATIDQDDVTALIGAMWRPREDGGQGLKSQSVGVSHHLAGLFDYAVLKRKMAVNPVRIAKPVLPRRKSRGKDAEKPQAFVRTIEDARRVLAAVEASNAGPFLKLAHRLIALTGSRKLEGLEAAWSELSADCLTWTVPAERMKSGEEHIVYLSPAARQVFLTAHRLATDDGIKSAMCFPGAAKSGALHHSTLTALLSQVLKRIGLEGCHVTHGWRSTFCTIMAEKDIRYEILTDLAIAHSAYRGAQQRYQHARYIADRITLATEWSELLLQKAPSAFALAGYSDEPADNVVSLRTAA